MRRPPQLLLGSIVSGWLARLLSALYAGAVLNVVGLLLTALGTYLTIRGNSAIKKGKAVAASARRNVLIQVAASEIGTLNSQVAVLRIHAASKRWDVSQHISGELSSKLHESKAAFVEIRGINRDRLDVAARVASEVNDYLTTTTDSEDAKLQRVQEYCNYLGTLLGDVYGGLKLKEAEESIL